MGVRVGWGINVSLALLFAAGCGSRTSMLDSDAYTDEGDDDVIMPGTGGKGGSTSPMPATGGKSSSGGSGPRGGQASRGGQPASGGASGGAFPSAGAPVGGSFGTAGTGVSTGGSAPTPGTTTQQICTNYCKGYANTCSVELDGRDCVALCAAEVDGFGKSCQRLGLKAVKCLTPSFQKPNLSCGEATSQGLNRCGAGVNRFQECKRDVAPTPVPTDPTPANCDGFASGDGQSCKMGLTCVDGNYTVGCQLLNNGYYACNCYYPNGATANTQVNANGPEFACGTAAQYCGFPGQ
jgi:hypothetical protein